MNTPKMGPKEAELRAMREKREMMEAQLGKPRGKADRLKVRGLSRKVEVVKLKSRRGVR
jgi:hypothetical protein